MRRVRPASVICAVSAISLVTMVTGVATGAERAVASGAPAPNTKPTGGSVVGGTATIQNTPTGTTISQSSARAVINWASFSAGVNEEVYVQQPSPSAVTLMRTTGTDPSQIAGRIVANGTVVITNAAGTKFFAGSQSNAQGLVVSVPGISNAQFMAGKLTFNQPGKPAAAVNSLGDLTSKGSPIVLVAPYIVSGGQIVGGGHGPIVLAAADEATVDEFGEGLAELEVTKAVMSAPDGNTPLIQNSGVLQSGGGKIALIAAAAPGLLTTLINVGGALRAQNQLDRTGLITVTATGGAITLRGTVAATGAHPGLTGGAVCVNASTAVTVAQTAKVDVSGEAGGGSVAFGMNPSGSVATGCAVTSATQNAVGIAPTAAIHADATVAGDGGGISLDVGSTATVDGTLTATGGSRSGNGGAVAISAPHHHAGTATIDVSAPHGSPGAVQIS